MAQSGLAGKHCSPGSTSLMFDQRFGLWLQLQLLPLRPYLVLYLPDLPRLHNHHLTFPQLFPHLSLPLLPLSIGHQCRNLALHNLHPLSYLNQCLIHQFIQRLLCRPSWCLL